MAKTEDKACNSLHTYSFDGVVRKELVVYKRLHINMWILYLSALI